MKKLSLLLILVLVLIPAFAFAVQALPQDAASFGSYGVATIIANSSLGQATYYVPATEAWFTGDYSWTLSGQVTLTDQTNGKVIGYLNGLTISAGSDPNLGIDFTARAGAATGGTTFTILSGINFQNIQAGGYAGSSQIGCTDRNRNGATLNGLFDGKAFCASGNSAFAADESSSLIDTPIHAGLYGSNSGSEDASGDFRNLSGLYEAYKFNLTAGDSVSGTSFFDVQPVPEPGSVMMLGMGLSAMGVFLRRRK